MPKAPSRAQAASRRAASGGAPDRAGFTLVELLMVVAIIGLAAGAVVLSVPDPRPSVAEDAERFAARLSRAREEAILTNRPVEVEATPAGYGFLVFDGARWSALVEGPFGPETWTAGTRLEPSDVRIVFDPTGVAEPAVLTLTRDHNSRTVTVDGAGEVTLNG
jgi:general secretion pathway protein H